MRRHLTRVELARMADGDTDSPDPTSETQV